MVSTTVTEEELASISQHVVAANKHKRVLEATELKNVLRYNQLNYLVVIKFSFRDEELKDTIIIENVFYEKISSTYDEPIHMGVIVNKDYIADIATHYNSSIKEVIFTDRVRRYLDRVMKNSGQL